jgi:L-lactate dehydrogenase complex protein LldF
VLWARDAGQARSLILEIARKHGVEAVVKAKSMATEEIALNPALTAAGLRVLETDLGEFIVQLAAHPPAHITAPALHLNRRQIAAIFRKHLGEAASEDPAALARQAMAYLRPHFYEAQMGITGVNFAAPDGTLVLLENEGNLRLTATLPPVHVALMGLEKLIPRLADAEVLLRLLPASATGQRLTALVHFIRGLKPRPGGTQAFYLILLDNGRRRLAATPEVAEALYCLRCGACLNVCPIFQAGGAHLYGRVYPGAMGILLAPFLAPTADLCDLCTQCGACEEICPVKIPLAEKILYLRRQSPRGRRLRACSRGAGLLLSRPGLYRLLEPAFRRLFRLLPGPANYLKGIDWSGGSFHRQWSRGQGGGPMVLPPNPITNKPRPIFPSPWRGEGQGGGEHRPGAAPEGPPAPQAAPLQGKAVSPGLAARLTEARASYGAVRGPGELARLLAAAAGPLWFENHPWLGPVAQELQRLGVTAHFPGDDWAPAAQTAVAVALGAVPETGSLLVAGGAPGGWLGFRAQKLVLLTPPDRAHLTLAQALELSRPGGHALISWLTGPTRTADIEKVLVIGAQDPRELEVILYEAEA